MPIQGDSMIVSDVAARHVGSLDRGGPPSLALLADLAAICEAAVLSETLIASPFARDALGLLQELDFVQVPEISVTDEESDPSAPAIEIRLDDQNRLASDSKEGEVLLSFVDRIFLVKDDVFGGLMSEAGPGQAGRPIDYLDRLPINMALLQLRKGALPFEDDEARRYFADRIDPSLKAFYDYVSRVSRLETRFGVRPVWSCLEAPLAEDMRARLALSPLRDAVDAHAAGKRDKDWNGFIRMYAETLQAPRAQHGLFEAWSAPPIGLMALAEAPSLDDLPDTLNRLRDVFQPIRKDLNERQRQKAALLTGESVLDDRGLQEANRIDALLEEAFAAFAKEADARRKTPEIRGVEWVLRIPKLIGAFKSLGYGTFSGLLSLVDLRRSIFLSNVPNFRKSLDVMRRFDQAHLVELVGRHLKADHRHLGAQPSMLALASTQAMGLHEVLAGQDPPPDGALTLAFEGEDGPEEVELPYSHLWMTMARDKDFRTYLLHPPVSSDER